MLQTCEVLKSLRIKNKYTQTETALKLGLKLSTYQKYESGSIVNIKLDTIREMCNIFNVPPVVFVFPNLSDEQKLDLLRWAIAKYSGLNDEGVNKVISYMDDMRKIHIEETGRQ